VLQSRPPSKTKSLTGRANQPIYDKPISPLTWCSIPPAFSVKIDAAWKDNRKLYGTRKVWHVLLRDNQDDARWNG